MKPGNSIILDLETLDTSPTALITEIGIIAFERESLTVIDHIEIIPDFFEQLGTGRTFDADTIAFHRRNGTLPENKASTQTPCIHAAVEIAHFFREHRPQKVWIQGTCFDRPLVENFFRSLSQPLPWHFAISRDARTIWDTAFPGVKHPKRPHTALQDCQDTLADLIKALSELGRIHTI